MADPEGSFVETAGSGSASSPPDVALVRLGLSCRGETVAAALSDLTSTSGALLDALAAHDVAAAHIQATRASIDQEWDHEARVVVGYLANQTFTVRLDNVAAVGAVVGAAAEAGGDAFRMHGLSWMFADAEPLLRLARESAFRDAQSKAHQYAQLAGRSLAEVLWVRESDGDFEPRPMRAFAVMVGSAEVAPGESEITATVTVRWRLA
jgi:uncharacterized protein YggE